MAPNASPFYNFNMDNHATLIQKNICHQFNNRNSLLKNSLQSVRAKFVAINRHYLRENIIEPVSHFSSSSVIGREKNINTWFDDLYSVSSMRLELIRKNMVKQTLTEKLEMWFKKKDEMSRNRKFDVLFKPKVQRDEILVKKENYQLIFNQIQQRSNSKQAVVFDHLQRSREICFKAVLAQAISISSFINNCFNDQQLMFKIGKEIYVYNSMESSLNDLKKIQIVEKETLISAQNLVKDLTLYKNNIVIPTKEKIESLKLKINSKKCILNKFSINTPDWKSIQSVRRQYVALVKNNKVLIQNICNIRNIPFISDPTKKIFRQNLTRVINTLVNTISSTNVRHLNEKYNKLNLLLSGKLVCVANTKVMIGDNKEAMAFCMETLATKLISYAEEVISVKTQVAYAIAAVITKLWSVHQQFGKILYAEIKEKCPLLVPFAHPVSPYLTANQIDHKSFGYKFDSLGNVESDEKYLRRMTGIVRLYAAIIITSSKYDQSVIGLSQAWIFVAGTLNQNPVANITATILVEFLNIVGFSMHQSYGKQFIKLLEYILTQYLKKIILITPEGNGGPITRLNSFISTSLSNSLLEEPKGMLSSDFW
ncbi:nucleoporin GLE1-like [Sipha flava]|uniref:mRNA export factor GLE1 n=1 Tax=Sipha flava TaxID=143950 RepID=A0A8B8F7N9_9HEMI|nr:nucleoporin GLE1-like [Sipha flava]